MRSRRPVLCAKWGLTFTVTCMLVGADGHAVTEVPQTIDPVTQQAYLKASNTGVSDLFGSSVAVSGDTAVVGAWAEDSDATGIDGDGTNNNAGSAGAAYVFVRTAGVWSQQAYLKPSNSDAADQFGFSVAVSGDIIVVGAPGEDGNATGINGDATSNSAGSAGAAYVFVRNGGVWSQQAYLKASNTGAGDSFGVSVAASGDTVVVGANSEDSNAVGIGGDGTNNSASGAGAAYVFVRSADVWSQQAYLKASNTGAGDAFGGSVAASNDTVVVGAQGEDSSATGVAGNEASNTAANAGAAYVFVRNAGIWSQQAYLKPSNTGAGDSFGVSVAASGDTIVVGAPNEASSAIGIDGDGINDSAASAGAAYVFLRTVGVWSQQAYLKASNTSASDTFGVSVAVSADAVMVGAHGEDSNATGIDGDGTNNSAGNAGAAYMFARTVGIWSQQAYLKASNTGAGDTFGISVGVSGFTAVVGAQAEDSNATGVDGAGGNNSAADSGAAYVFTSALPDLDPPEIDCEEADGVWHPGNVTLPCVATDTDSGLADPGDAEFTLVTSVAADEESADAFTDSRQVCDQAGNCATAQVGGNQVDRRAPWVGIDTPLPDTTVTVGQVVAAGYSCDDFGSGLTSCAGPVPSGAPIDTSSVGLKAFEVTGIDAVGNTRSAASDYTVAYGICSLGTPAKEYKAGSTAALKLQLCDASGANISSPAVYVTVDGVISLSTSTTVWAAGSGQANLGMAFRYSDGQYILNLSLKGLEEGAYQLEFHAGADPTTHTISFLVR